MAAKRTASAPAAVAKAAPAVQTPMSAPQRPRNIYMDGSGPWGPPAMTTGMQFSTIGSGGLRQWGGWVREEFLPQLQGRQAARVYREMLDNSATVGAIVFAIMQTMRQVEWRLNGPDDTPKSMQGVEFVESCMNDMSHTWDDFVAEQLSMLPYGFAPHELVYKRRMGRKPPTAQQQVGNTNRFATSKYDDGLVGWRKIPLRGQDTVIKWFFDPDGAVTGMTQQPWVGSLIDIPIEKMLLFRPKAHKNNPEGNSILRTAYRSWFFQKRLEEQEAIMLERFGGLPVVTIPMELFEAAQAGDANAVAMVDAYKNIGRNVRVDDQMCVVLPSNPYKNTDGTYAAAKMYGIEFVTPQSSKGGMSADGSIERYKLDIMTSVLADFLTMGHSSKGTQSLANTKVDLFFQATEGWVGSNAEVMNRYALPRLWALNGMDEETQPLFSPDMPQRTDLDVLSNFVLRLSQAGMPLFPDPDTDQYLRDAAGLPDVADENAESLLAHYMAQNGGDPTKTNPAEGAVPGTGNATAGNEDIKKLIAGALTRRLIRKGYRPDLAGPGKKKR